jgi:DNA ligase-associated metallophosphoesterase
MYEVDIFQTKLRLLPEKAVYVEALNSLLVSDVHLGKSETFQAAGIPIANTVNQQTLERLRSLLKHLQPAQLFILGDLFHSKYALVDEVLDAWKTFLSDINSTVTLIVGNHDRALVQQLQHLPLNIHTDTLQIGNLLLSHEPESQSQMLNICGHIHPCVRIRTKLDDLRLPCFYLNQTQNVLTLPSFGEFTGGYEMPLKRGAIAYAIVENQIVVFGDRPIRQ